MQNMDLADADLVQMLVVGRLHVQERMVLVVSAFLVAKDLHHCHPREA
jgi:hypothetical protein